MNLTFEELKEKLKMIDEVSLIEMLDIRSDDIVERFYDVIEDQQQKLRRMLDD